MSNPSAVDSSSEQSNVTVLRRQNLIALRQQFAESRIAGGESPTGVGQAFAKSLELSPSMLSQILASRPISDKVARQIESHCDKEAGWLDLMHQPDAPNPALDAFLALAAKVWEKSSRVQRNAMTHSLKQALKGAD